MKRKISFLFSTFFYTGLCPVAPGTAGSLASFILIVPSVYLWGFKGLFLVAVIAFIISIFSVSETLKYTQHDPGFIVIDEFIGQSVTMLPVADFLCNNSKYWWLYVAGFIFFRLFDVKKPFPVCYFDKKIRNAYGVILDDVSAGIYAAVCVWLIKIVAI